MPVGTIELTPVVARHIDIEYNMDSSMKERFEGPENSAALIRALNQQIIVKEEPAIAAALADVGEIVEIAPGVAFIEQDAAVQDVFLILMGNAAIIVNKAQIATRTANEHVGEMVVLDQSLPRSATVVALDTVVALKIDGQRFLTVCDRFKQVWERIAQVLARRLYQRNSTIFIPNSKPHIFVISSSEAADVAHAIRDDLSDVADVIVWDADVFLAGGFTIESLEQQLALVDYAIAVAMPDDQIITRGKTKLAVRDNVVFELGLFMGKLSRFRAFLFHPNVADFTLASDFNGLTTIRYEAGTAADIKDKVRPACDQVRKIIGERKVRTFEFENR